MEVGCGLVILAWLKASFLVPVLSLVPVYSFRCVAPEYTPYALCRPQFDLAFRSLELTYRGSEDFPLAKGTRLEAEKSFPTHSLVAGFQEKV